MGKYPVYLPTGACYNRATPGDVPAALHISGRQEKMAVTYQAPAVGRWKPALCALAAVAGCGYLSASNASAQHVASYRITGEFGLSGDVYGEISDTSFINRNSDNGSNGNLDILTQGPFDIDRQEVFPVNYSTVRTFGYFGLMSTYTTSGSTLIDREFFVAGHANLVLGVAFGDLFEDYLDAHPHIEDMADFVAVVDATADNPLDPEGNDPLPQINQDFRDLNDFIFANLVEFAGDVETHAPLASPPQVGDTLDLIRFNSFDPDFSGVGNSFGTIHVEAIEGFVPEPTAMALLIPAAAMALRRSRRA
jgi:hypothetical protein